MSVLSAVPAAAQTVPGGKASGEVELPAISVTGDRETATSPVTGYVANRTATGTKTDTPLVETPQSISVVPRDQMTHQNVQSLNDVVRYIPGVAPETRGAVATRYDMLTIRGFEAETYLNGLKLQRMYYTLPQIDPYLLERVEVLKGPSSVLYGQAAAGGLINQTSKLPTATPQREVGIEFGNLGHWRGMFDASGPLDSEGRFLYRLTATGLTEKGQIDRTRNERVAVAPSFTWRPDADTSLTLMGLYQHDPRATSYGGIPPQGTVLHNPLGKIPVDFYDGDPNFETFDRTQTALGYQFERRLSDVWTVRSNGRWFHSVQDYESVYANGLAADNRTLFRGTATSHDRMDSVALDNQVQATFSTGPVQHTLLVGADYQHLDGNYTSGFGMAPSLDVFAPIYRQTIIRPALGRTDVDGNQYGLYVQDQLKLGGWALTLAGRQDWADTRTTSAFGTTDQFDRAFTGRAGLLYLFENGIAPYVSYAESFTPQSGTDFSGKPFDPERGRQYEVGIKYQPTGMNSLFTASVFELTRSNLLTADPVHPGLSVQSGEARTCGVELEAKVNLNQGLSLTAGYTYLDTVLTKDNGGLEGNRLAAVPHHLASAWAYYTVQDGPLAGLGIGAGGRYIGKTYNTANTFKVPDVFLVDAVLSYDLGRVSQTLAGAEATLNAKNLLNKEYVASCYYGEWCAYGYQRTVVAGLRYRW